MNWKDKLTKKELDHLQEAGIDTIAQFEENHIFHEKMRSSNGNDPVVEPCWDCKFIARKLGFIK